MYVCVYLCTFIFLAGLFNLISGKTTYSIHPTFSPRTPAVWPKHNMHIYPYSYIILYIPTYIGLPSMLSHSICVTCHIPKNGDASKFVVMVAAPGRPSHYYIMPTTTTAPHSTVQQHQHQQPLAYRYVCMWYIGSEYAYTHTVPHDRSNWKGASVARIPHTHTQTCTYRTYIIREMKLWLRRAG